MAKITIARNEEPIAGITAAYVAPEAVVNETPTTVEETVTPAIVENSAAPIVENAEVAAVVEETEKKITPSNTVVSFGEGASVAEISSTSTEAAQPEKVDVNELLKTLPKEKLYELLGLDEQDIKFSEFRKKGGNPYEFIQERSIDWNKVPDEQMVKQDLQKQYPTLSSEKIEKLFAAKYKQDEMASDEDKEFGAILMEADAHTARQKNIEQQKKNEFTTVATPQAQPNEYEAMVKQSNQQANELASYIITSEPVKNFLTQKILKVDVGNGNYHNFEIDNPKHLIDVLLDDKVSSQYGVDAQGKPDTQLMLELGLHKAAPQKYKEGLIEYGRSLALLDELLKDGQNAKKPSGATPRPNGVSDGNKKITPTTGRITPYGG